MKTYPEILGENLSLVPEAARSAEWFMSLPSDQRKYLWICLTERSLGHALGYILSIVRTQPPVADWAIAPVVVKPAVVKIPPEQKRQKKETSALPRSPIPVPYVLDFGAYLLLLRDRHIRTATQFDASYQYVALGHIDGGECQQICFGKNFRSIAGKISWLRKQGAVIEDLLVHALRPGKILETRTSIKTATRSTDCTDC